jgi:DNA (cytosine-5)-methyltransferase 1
MMNFRLGELFCGPGGLAWGALNSEPTQSSDGQVFSIAHAWANDLDPCTCETYARNILLKGEASEVGLAKHVIPVGEWRTEISYGSKANKLPSVISGNVRELTPILDRLPEIDALAFGFPCNDFSYVGERRGLDGDFGPLYRYGVQVLNIHSPKWFIAENVEGLVHDNKGKTFLHILDELSNAGDGYVVTPHLYRFEEYGVPQSRTRLVMVGIAQSEADRGICFRVPKPPLTNAEQYVSAFQALEEGRGTLPEGDGPIPENWANHKFTRNSPTVIKRLEHTNPGQNAWNADIPDEYALHVKKAHLSQIYRRLERDKPAYTITGSGGGGTHGYHWEEPRSLTNRERARLQSFPDQFVFQGGEQSVRKQIGMAVPPLAAKALFEAILKTFAGIPYEYVEPHIGEAAQKRLNKHRLQPNT